MPRMNRRRWLRWVALPVMAGLLVAASVPAALWLASQRSGKTPAELLDYAGSRLPGHHRLAELARPPLKLLRGWLADEDESQARRPFAVPQWPANPMQAAAGTPGDAPELIRVGPGRAITRIGQAARLAHDGSVIEIDPGDYVADVASWEQSRITIRGLGRHVRLIANGASAEGKATWVFRSRHALVENIQFFGARARDRNGAGIRLERGQLTVRGCAFFGGENGILTSSEPGTRLEVEDSEFGWNGRGDGLTHGIYVGRIDGFRLTGSYLHHGNVGHLVKSRAHVNRIEYNRITDEQGRSSYELDLPDGGVAQVVGNVFQKGRAARNSTLVSFGAEGYRLPLNVLKLAHNTFVSDLRFGGSFLRVAAGPAAVSSFNNVFVGAAQVFAGDAFQAAGDVTLDVSDLVDPGAGDHRLTGRARAALAARPLAETEPELVPRFEYRHPASTRPLPLAPRWPGALQSDAGAAL